MFSPQRHGSFIFFTSACPNVAAYQNEENGNFLEANRGFNLFLKSVFLGLATPLLPVDWGEFVRPGNIRELG